MLICHLYIFIGEVLWSLIGLFVFLFLSLSSLNILDDSHLSDVSFANIIPDL